MCVDPDLTAVPPVACAIEWWQRIDDGPQECGFPLAVIADHDGALTVLDFQMNRIGHRMILITDSQPAAAEGRAATQIGLGYVESNTLLVGLLLEQVQFFELLLFASCL